MVIRQGCMNKFLELSLEYAQQPAHAYLDDLFKVYPTIPNAIRSVDTAKWESVECAFARRDNLKLVESLLSMDLFPIKDSYVAFLRHDRAALLRNPNTVNRLAGELYGMGLGKIYERSTLPKETNRQIGPLFRYWLRSNALGIAPVPIEEFAKTEGNAILDAGDAVMKAFAKERLGYGRDKGLDFIARFNGKYVIGEAKFLTDFGGHQNAQFNDAIATLESPSKAVNIAIMDGVLYIKNNNKMHKELTGKYGGCNIMSALLLRDFLHSI